MNSEARPQPLLSVADGVAICVGVVVGAGIFKTPSIVASTVGSFWGVMLLWLAGGLVTLVGALTYAELAAVYPDAGGDYFYLKRAFGDSTAFLFVWARMTVIQTGSIAMWAFLIGDYVTAIVPLGAFSSSIYAALVIVLLTILNILGIRPGLRFQKVFIAIVIVGILVMGAMGIRHMAPAAGFGGFSLPSAPAAGSAMIFILLTYGGWNEAVYLSGEVSNPGRSMVRVLVASVIIITGIYTIINLVFLASMGVEGTAASEAVAADLMKWILGEPGAIFISILITAAALSSMNGVMITSARTTYAVGRDFAFCSFLGQWRGDRGTPVNALFFLGATSLALVVFASGSINGFRMMVEYTAPVFWFFFLLTGIAFFILRRKDQYIERPYRTPLYPLTPFLFAAVCAFMLRASVIYTGSGALLGVAILVTGLPLRLIGCVKKKDNTGAAKENVVDSPLDRTDRQPIEHPNRQPDDIL